MPRGAWLGGRHAKAEQLDDAEDNAMGDELHLFLSLALCETLFMPYHGTLVLNLPAWLVTSLFSLS